MQDFFKALKDKMYFRDSEIALVLIIFSYHSHVFLVIIAITNNHDCIL